VTKTNNPNLGWGAPLKRWSSRWKRRWPRRVLVDASERVCVCISVVIRTDSLSTSYSDRVLWPSAWSVVRPIRYSLCGVPLLDSNGLGTNM
jgi:hypothetical protein